MNKITLIVKYIYVFLFFMISSVAYTQDTPEEVIKSFFNKLENDGTSDAIDYAYSTNKWMNLNKDGITNLKNQMASLNDEEYIGKYYGYSLITKENLNADFVLYSYLVKYDRQPIRFTFVFYRPNEEWKLYSFKYDDGFVAELEESAKVYFINNRYD